MTVGLFISRRRSSHIDRPFKVWLPFAVLFLAAQVFVIVTPFIRPKNGKGDTRLPYWLAPLTSVVIMLGGVVGWFIWRVLIPRIGGFTWLTEETELSDGTIVQTWRRSNKQAYVPVSSTRRRRLPS